MTQSARTGGPAEEPHAPTEARPPQRFESGASIAIVGMVCRFPGADGIGAFWRLLEAGGNAVQEGIPGSGVGRVGALFPDDSGQIDACRFGAYLDEIDQFDAAFFRISPVEAHLLDPQQRLILETSWRALEDAGLDPDRLKDSRTGVYAGISNNDYRGLILEASENAGPSEPAASLYAVTGTSLNTAIGRVAFALGLGGPAMAVDTACSSSLVATHQAVTGLQRGDADLALAGGVNIILSGRLLEYRANAGMLSPDGQCKTFDASANGYVRGEGCGIVVLKRLADAQADGDRIWGVVRGTALNQDGASPGLTVPNGAAQERVIEAALERAGIQPSDIDYLEAHGTGTEVGDPIEIDATAAVYGRGRDTSRPLLIGSVKTNIGHLESAAGVAGIIKTVLAMNRGVIPRHLHSGRRRARPRRGRLDRRCSAADRRFTPGVQRGALGHQRTGGGDRRDPRASGGERHSGRAAAQEPRLPQRHDRAGAGPDVWRQALADAGFSESEVLGVDRSAAAGLPDRGVIVAQGPAKIDLPEGVWILAADRGGVAEALAAQLATRNQTVVLAGLRFGPTTHDRRRGVDFRERGRDARTPGNSARSRESEKFRGYDNEWRSRNSRIAAAHSSGFSSWRKCVVSGMKS